MDRNWGIIFSPSSTNMGYKEPLELTEIRRIEHLSVLIILHLGTVLCEHRQSNNDVKGVLSPSLGLIR